MGKPPTTFTTPTARSMFEYKETSWVSWREMKEQKHEWVVRWKSWVVEWWIMLIVNLPISIFEKSHSSVFQQSVCLFNVEQEVDKKLRWIVDYSEILRTSRKAQSSSKSVGQRVLRFEGVLFSQLRRGLVNSWFCAGEKLSFTCGSLSYSIKVYL